jgi:RNA polymerase sigma-70 factor, ECF subfamily
MASPSDTENRDLGRFREYLSLLSRLPVDHPLQGKLDLSGVVQQTLFEAHQAWDQIGACSDEQKAAWLRRALANNLADELRRLSTQKRNLVRERSIEAALDQSSGRVSAWLAAEQSSPSQQAVRHERAVGLANALAQLPENQRRAVELRHLRGHSLAETARLMGCTTPAVVGLLYRGMNRLRELLPPDEGDTP